MTSNTTPSSLGADQPRQGKWTKEEEAYVDLLIEEFRCGALPLREGTTLRSFLSKMINCNPKRVSKKYENTNYNGKHKYEPSTIPMSLEEMKRRRERLQEYERRFLVALKRSEDELDMDEEELKASLEESRAAAALNKEKEGKAMAALLEQQKFKTAAANKRASLVPSGFQDRLTAELQTRMDRANQLSGSGPTADMRDMSLSNTANMTLSQPMPFMHPAYNKGSSIDQLASFEMMSSFKQSSPGYATSTTIGGLSGQPTVLEDDPLGWQVRLQRRAGATTNMAPRSVMDRMSLATTGDKSEVQPFPRPQFLRQPNHPQEDSLKRLTADTPFPSLPSPQPAHRLIHTGRGATMDQLSHLQLASLVAREERLSLGSGLVSNAGGFEATRRSSLMSELEMMETLKRGRERQDAMDTLQPFKRLR